MPSIFDFAGSDAANSKMRVTQGSLPPYIDAAQPPPKKSPWRQIKELPFVSTLIMLMPDEMCQMIWNKLDAEVKTMKYAKVIMKLQEVLEGDFFTEYIKKGMPALLFARSTCSFGSVSRRCCLVLPVSRTAAHFHERTRDPPLFAQHFAPAIPAVAADEAASLT